MTTRLDVAIRNAQADVVGAAMSGGTIEIRSGSQPAHPADTATGDLLATIDLDTAGSASGGVVTMPDPDPATAVDDGTAGWFRVLSSTSDTVFDGQIGVDGMLSPTTIVTGVAVTLSAIAYTVPE